VRALVEDIGTRSGFEGFNGRLSAVAILWRIGEITG
jgi:hypothetical protein